METRLVKINNMEDCKKDMEEAGELIKAGELVAFPTETVYGTWRESTVSLLFLSLVII